MRRLLCALAVLALAGCQQSTDLPFQFTDRWSGNVSSMEGRPGIERSGLNDDYAPDFRWHRADGSLDSLSAHQGKIVVLNFWATWCGYCVHEMPAMDSISSRLRDTVDVIGVSTDNTGDVFSHVRTYINEHPYSYQFVIDSNYTIYNRYLLFQTTGIPQTFIIDQNGSIQQWFQGEQTQATLLRTIRQLE